MRVCMTGEILENIQTCCNYLMLSAYLLSFGLLLAVTKSEEHF